MPSDAIKRRDSWCFLVSSSCFSFWSHARIRRVSLCADQCGHRGDPAQHAFGAGTPWLRSMGRGGEARPIATRVGAPKISLVDCCHTECLPRCWNGFQSFDMPLAVSTRSKSPPPPEAWLQRPAKHKVGRLGSTHRFGFSDRHRGRAVNFRLLRTGTV